MIIEKTKIIKDKKHNVFPLIGFSENLNALAVMAFFVILVHLETGILLFLRLSAIVKHRNPPVTFCSIPALQHQVNKINAYLSYISPAMFQETLFFRIWRRQMHIVL